MAIFDSQANYPDCNGGGDAAGDAYFGGLECYVGAA